MSRARGALVLLAAYIALTLLFTYPLVELFGTHHLGEAGGDAKVYLWNYWWVREALTSGKSPFETEAIFYPLGIGLSLHTLGSFQGLVFTPLSAVLGDVRAANAVVLWTFVASALATYALAREVGAGRAGAFAAGFVFAFCPYRMARLSGHYDLLGTEWIPLYALVLLRVTRAPRFSGGGVVLAGAVAAACGYTASTYLVFLGLFTLLLLAFEWRRFGELLPRAAAIGIVAAALLSPLLAQMARDLSRWTYPPYPGADRYAADLLGYVRRGASGDNLTETTVFAGWLVLATAVTGLWMRRRRPRLSFWLLTAGVFYVLSLGTSLSVAGTDTGVPLPFALVTRLPLLEQLRAPSRFAIVVMLALAVVVGVVWSEARPRVALALTAVAALEYAALPVPVFAAEVHPVYARIGAEPDRGTVVEIPGIEQSPQEVMYHQTAHGKPIFIGTAARVPREKSEYYFGIPLIRPLIEARKGRLAVTDELVAAESATAPAVARFFGLGYFVVDVAYAKRGVVELVERTLPTERWYEDAETIVLKVDREALPPNPARLDAAAPESRQHYESGWLRPESDFRWSNRERASILFRRPRGATRAVLELAPLDGLALELDASLDGAALGRRALEPGWQEVTLELPPSRGSVERLELRWSELKQASERDPRVVAARVRALRFD